MIKSHKYVTNTWLSSQVFHTIMHYLYFIQLVTSWKILDFIFFAGMSMVFSFPGYIAVILLFQQIKLLNGTVFHKMILLILSAAIIIWGSISIAAMLLFHPVDWLWCLQSGTPAFFAALISIAIRYRQFIKSLKSNIHETLFP